MCIDANGSATAGSVTVMSTLTIKKHLASYLINRWLARCFLALGDLDHNVIPDREIRNIDTHECKVVRPTEAY
jgi:hypothetical protein